MSRQSVYAGLSRTQLQTQLNVLQQAYMQLTSGKQIANVSYSQADGAKSVTYRAADLGMLTAQISEIQKLLGVVRHARRQIRLIHQ